MAPGAMQDELKNNIDSSLLWLLSPQGVYRYLDKIMKKRQMGQPVSFTDFFGHMVGETLLKGVNFLSFVQMILVVSL
jgi:phospholipase A2